MSCLQEESARRWVLASARLSLPPLISLSVSTLCRVSALPVLFSFHSSVPFIFRPRVQKLTQFQLCGSEQPATQDGCNHGEGERSLASFLRGPRSSVQLFFHKKGLFTKSPARVQQGHARS